MCVCVGGLKKSVQRKTGTEVVGRCMQYPHLPDGGAEPILSLDFTHRASGCIAARFLDLRHSDRLAVKGEADS